jgi:hypothetical protein
LRLNTIQESNDRVGGHVVLLDRCREADEAEETLGELVGLGSLKAGEEEDEDRSGHVGLEGGAVRVRTREGQE